MPLQNRVNPLGELVADPARGLVYGNRGCLHDETKRIRRRSNGKRWIACRLEFRGWQRGPLLKPGRFTELFFLYEATAFAAGHRPCALCRRGDYARFVGIWRELHPGRLGADAIDAQLHAERVDPATRAQLRHEADRRASRRLVRRPRRYAAPGARQSPAALERSGLRRAQRSAIAEAGCAAHAAVARRRAPRRLGGAARAPHPPVGVRRLDRGEPARLAGG